MPVSLASTSASSMHGAVVPLTYVSGFSGSSQQVVLTNIPQGYQDLMIVGFGRTTYSAYATSYSMILNNDFSSLYSNTVLGGNGSSAYSGRITSVNYGLSSDYMMTAASATSGIFASSVAHILNYANSSTYKTVLMRGAADTNGNGGTSLSVGLYRSTSPITQIMIQTNGNYVSGSTFALYGVRTVNQ